MNDRFFELKVASFVFGAGFGIAGMITEKDWLVWIGVACLAVGIILRIWSKRNADRAD